MKNLELNIGKICNNNCRFCMNKKIEDNVKFIDLKEIRCFLDNKNLSDYGSVGILGGEPTIYPLIFCLKPPGTIVKSSSISAK